MDELDEHSGSPKESGSVWTSYSDLFMAIAVVFLVMFVFTMLKSGLGEIKHKMEAQNTFDYLRGKIPEKVKKKNEIQKIQAQKTLESIRAKEKSIQSSLSEIRDLSVVLENNQKLVQELVQDQVEKQAVLESTNKKIKDRESQITDLQKNVVKLKKKANDFQVLEASLSQKIESLTKDLETKKESINELKKSISNKESLIAKTSKKLKEEESLAMALQNKIEIQANQEKELLERLKDRDSSLKNSQKKINELYQKLTQLEGSNQEKSSLLKDSQAQVQALLADLDKSAGEIRDGKNRIKFLTRSLASSEEKLGQLSDQLSSQSAFGNMLEMGKGKVSENNGVYRAYTEREAITQGIIQDLLAQGISVDINPHTGIITLSMDEVFLFKNDSAELSEAAKLTLKKMIPIYAKGLFADPKVASRIRQVTLTGFASPRYGGETIDLKNHEDEAYSHNLNLSIDRAKMIGRYIFGEEIGFYKHKLTLKTLTSISGKSFMNPIKDNPPSPLRTIASEQKTGKCGAYSCKLSRRVEVGFILKD